MLCNENQRGIVMWDIELDDEQFEKAYGVSKDEVRAAQRYVDAYWKVYGEDLADNDDD